MKFKEGVSNSYAWVRLECIVYVLLLRVGAVRIAEGLVLR